MSKHTISTENSERKDWLSENFSNVIACVEIGGNINVRQIIVHFPFTVWRSCNHDEPGKENYVVENQMSYEYNENCKQHLNLDPIPYNQFRSICLKIQVFKLQFYILFVLAWFQMSQKEMMLW